eukprot:11180916-Lingulodinium_polyedra.AAC.1
MCARWLEGHGAVAGPCSRRTRPSGWRFGSNGRAQTGRRGCPGGTPAPGSGGARPGGPSSLGD